MYPKVGDVLKKKSSGCHAYICPADPRLPELVRVADSRRTPLVNGAMECRLLEYKRVAGGMRRVKETDVTHHSD